MHLVPAIDKDNLKRESEKELTRVSFAFRRAFLIEFFFLTKTFLKSANTNEIECIFHAARMNVRYECHDELEKKGHSLSV